MLWLKLLINTTYCGTLELVSYRLYGQEAWRGLKNHGWPVTVSGSRTGAVFAPRRWHNAGAANSDIRSLFFQSGGPAWIRPLLP